MPIAALATAVIVGTGAVPTTVSEPALSPQIFEFKKTDEIPFVRAGCYLITPATDVGQCKIGERAAATSGSMANYRDPRMIYEACYTYRDKRLTVRWLDGEPPHMPKFFDKPIPDSPGRPHAGCKIDHDTTPVLRVEIVK